MTRTDDADAGRPEPYDDRLEDRLARWSAASLITAEQADRIRAFETAGRPAPVPAAPARIPLVAEALGFLGGSLAAIAGVLSASRFWDDLATGARLGLVGTVAALLVVAGRVVRRGDEPALDHLGSFLWVVATGAAAFFTGIAAVDVADVEGMNVMVAVGVTVTATAGALWRWRPAPLQHVTTLVGLALVVGGVTGRVEHVGGRFAGIGLWALGVAWVLLAWNRRVQPVALGYALGGVLTLFAGRIFTAEFAEVPDELVPVVTAVSFIAASVPASSLVLLWVGVAGVFMSVPFVVVRLFGDSAAAPLALFVAGMVLIGTAVVASRLAKEVKEPHAAGRRWSGRRVTLTSAGAATAVVVLLVATTPFRDVPEFDSLQAAPDRRIEGTVAYVSSAEDDACVVLAPASGEPGTELACEDEIGFEPDELWWTDDGDLFARHWGMEEVESAVIDAATGAVVQGGDAAAPTEAEVAFEQEQKFRGERSSDGARLETEQDGAGELRLVLRPRSGEPRTVLSVRGPIDYWIGEVIWSPDGDNALLVDSEERLLIVDVEAERPSARVLAVDARAPVWVK